MLPPTLAGGILPQPNGHSAQMTSGASACNPMAPPSGAAPLTAGPNGDIVLSNCTMPTSLYAMQFPGMDGSLSGKNSLALSSNGSFPAGVASFFQPSTKGQELSASQSQPTGIMSFPSMLQSNVSIVSAGTDPAVMQGQTLWGPMSDILAGWNGNTGSSLPINQSPTTEMPTHAHPRQLSMRSLRDRHLDHHRSANNTCHPDHQDSVDGDETDVMQLLTEETEALEDGHVFHPCQVMPSAGSSNRSPTPVLASQRLQPLLPAVMSSSVVAEALSAGDQSGQGHLHTGSECSTDPGDGLRGAPQLGGIPAAESAGTRHLDPHLEPVLSMFRSMIVSNNNAGIQASHPINLVDQHNAVLVSGMPSIARRPTAAFTGNGVSPHSSPSATLRQDDSQFEESVGSAGRAETIRVSQAAAATSSAVLYDQTNNLCSIGLDSTADESQKALKRRNPAATYNGVGALQQRVDGDGCISVVDPQRRKLRIPLSAIRPTKALNGRLTIPSLCLLYQSDRCRQDSNCYQVHADPAVIRQLRQQVIEVPCCCATHGDGNQHMLMECPNTEGRSISLNNGQTIISLSYLAYTTGLKQLIKDARQSVPINPLSLCRLHGSSEGCRFGADCKFIHMCKQIHNQIAATTAQPQLQPQLPTMSPPVVVGNPGHRTLGGTMSSTASSQMLSPTTSSMNGMMLTGGGSPPAGAIPRVTSATSLGSSHGGTTAYNSSFGAPMGTPMAPNVSDRFATQGAVTVGSPGLSNFPTSVGAAMPMAQQRMMFMPTGPSPPPPGTMPTSNLSGQVLWLPRGNTGPGGTSTSGGSAPAPPPQQQYLLPRMNPDGSVMLVPLFMPGGSGPQPPQC